MRRARNYAIFAKVFTITIFTIALSLPLISLDMLVILRVQSGIHKYNYDGYLVYSDRIEETQDRDYRLSNQYDEYRTFIEKIKFYFWLMGTMSLLLSISSDVNPNRFQFLKISKLNFSIFVLIGFIFFIFNLISDIIYFMLLPEDQFNITRPPDTGLGEIKYTMKLQPLFWFGILSLILLIATAKKDHVNESKPNQNDDLWPYVT